MERFCGGAGGTINRGEGHSKCAHTNTPRVTTHWPSSIGIGLVGSLFAAHVQANYVPDGKLHVL